MSFLSSHNYGYQISLGNLLTSVTTGASGLPYAKRHYELSNTKSSSSWIAATHRIIALIECMPLIGGIVAIVERIAYALFGSDSPPWRDHPITPEAASIKMRKNQEKALIEHKITGNSLPASIANLDKELKFSSDSTAAQGKRLTMEDAHFYIEMEDGILTGVFDGHGGSEVSAYANTQFQEKFPQALKKAKGNIHQAFETIIHQIHQEVANSSAWNHMGSTAVVCYIDKETHKIFTATLGDSEATIYRKNSWGNVVSIPLSCIRDWLSKKDLSRLHSFFGDAAVNKQLRAIQGNPKRLRSHLDQGVNVSRAIGDVDNTGKPDKLLVIHKPKITEEKLSPGDTLVLSCDGLTDFASKKEITTIVGGQSTGLLMGLFQKVFGKQKQQQEQPKILANQLVQAALKHMNSEANDNVTVVVVKVT